MTKILLHGAVGYWDEIGTVVAIISFVILMSFLAWSSGNKRRKAQQERRRRRLRQLRSESANDEE